MRDIDGTIKKAGPPASPLKKTCEKCRKEFFPEKPWHKRCRDCQRAEAHKSGPEDAQLSGRDFEENYPDYFDEQGVLKCEYVTSEARRIAERLKKGKMTMHQLRAFYQHVKLQEDALNSGRSFRDVRKDICSLEMFAHDRAAKRKVPKFFESFIALNVQRVTASQTDELAFRHTFLDGFVEHFQAVVAYCAGILKDERRPYEEVVEDRKA